MWPGFVTAITQFETSSMLIIDVSHKVLHFQTVLDVMYDVYNSCRGAPNFKELAAKKIIGQIVLTRSVFFECLQGDHWSGKPGNLREFETCQGNVRDFVNS